MKKVFKYPLRVTDNQMVMMPSGYEILSVQVQHGENCLWALVFPENPLVPVHIRMAGTGHPIKEQVKFLGTTQNMGGALVWHFFEIL